MEKKVYRLASFKDPTFKSTMLLGLIPFGFILFLIGWFLLHPPISENIIYPLIMFGLFPLAIFWEWTSGIIIDDEKIIKFNVFRKKAVYYSQIKGIVCVLEKSGKIVPLDTIEKFVFADYKIIYLLDRPYHLEIYQDKKFILLKISYRKDLFDVLMLRLRLNGTPT